MNFNDLIRMKYITHFLLYSLCLLSACKNSPPPHSNENKELSESEIIRIWGLIDPAPTTYQEVQINELIEFALAENWPVRKDSSGLVYWIAESGNDHRPVQTSSVQVRYKGRLLDGTIFDQSPTNGEPVVFRLSETIPAWKIALPMIGEGGKIKILAHSDLGYKGHQTGEIIPPYSPLIFDVELINVNLD